MNFDSFCWLIIVWIIIDFQSFIAQASCHNLSHTRYEIRFRKYLNCFDWQHKVRKKITITESFHFSDNKASGTWQQNNMKGQTKQSSVRMHGCFICFLCMYMCTNGVCAMDVIYGDESNERRGAIAAAPPFPQARVTKADQLVFARLLGNINLSLRASPSGNTWTMSNQVIASVLYSFASTVQLPFDAM